MEQRKFTPQIPTYEIVDIEMTKNEHGYTTPQEKFKAQQLPIHKSRIIEVFE